MGGYDDDAFRNDNIETMFWEDVQYMKSQYLPMSIEILGYVEDECDMMEYAGSLMFDQYPDKNGIDQVVKRVYQKAKYLENFYQPIQEENEEIAIQNHCTSCRGKESWLENLIRVILLNEMNYRRRRYNHRKRHRHH